MGSIFVGAELQYFLEELTFHDIAGKRMTSTIQWSARPGFQSELAIWAIHKEILRDLHGSAFRLGSECPARESSLPLLFNWLSPDRSPVALALQYCTHLLVDPAAKRLTLCMAGRTVHEWKHSEDTRRLALLCRRASTSVLSWLDTRCSDLEQPPLCYLQLGDMSLSEEYRGELTEELHSKIECKCEPYFELPIRKATAHDPRLLLDLSAPWPSFFCQYARRIRGSMAGTECRHAQTNARTDNSTCITALNSLHMNDETQKETFFFDRDFGQPPYDYSFG